ncbi:MAG: thioredoxin family protein [Thermoanaerobaculia bacterium]
MKTTTTPKARQIEIFTAGCSVCREVVARVRAAACSSCKVRVRSMRNPLTAKAAARYGIKSLPAVVIDGRVASCCAGRGVDLAELRGLGLGQALGA